MQDRKYSTTQTWRPFLELFPLDHDCRLLDNHSINLCGRIPYPTHLIG